MNEAYRKMACRECYRKHGKLVNLKLGHALTNRPKNPRRGEAIGPGGPPRRVVVLKCEECGYSRTM